MSAFESQKRLSLIEAQRRFSSELSGLINRKVEVRLADGKVYKGVLLGIDENGLNIIIGDAEDEQGRKYFRVVIAGSRLSEIIVEETPLFDPDEFASIVAQRLNLNPADIAVYRDSGFVMILHRYKVSEIGVEGEGFMANKIKDIWDDYMRSKKGKR